MWGCCQALVIHLSPRYRTLVFLFIYVLCKKYTYYLVCEHDIIRVEAYILNLILGWTYTWNGRGPHNERHHPRTIYRLGPLNLGFPLLCHVG
jgi:hypothetical protein